jgi:hypothetical protein
MSVAQEIKELKELLDSEVLTQEEFEEQKRKILSGSGSGNIPGNGQYTSQNGFTQAPNANQGYQQSFGNPNMPPVINIVNTNTNNNNNSNGMPMVPPKSKIVALLLCIFLGYLGVHRFYVGKVGTGLLYMFTGGLFGVGWLVDTILIIVGAFKDCRYMPLV